MKPPAPEPKTDDWIAQREQLAAGLAGIAGIGVTAGADGTLRVSIPSAEGFARDSDEVAPALAEALDRIKPPLAAHPKTAIQVIGHTDSMGSELYNLRLSIRRAEAVMEHLRAGGIALARLSADGRGEAEPIADNGSETERVKNRRVELVIRPLQ